MAALRVAAIFLAFAVPITIGWLLIRASVRKKVAALRRLQGEAQEVRRWTSRKP